MNDVEAARQKLEMLRSKDPGWAGLAEGLIDLVSGDLASAGDRLAEAARSTSDPRLRLAALWAVLERARLSGDSVALEAASEEITARYPGSPEQALAGGTAAPVSRPGQFASRALTAEPAPAPAAPGPAPLPRTEGPAEGGPRFGVQAGSFKVRENADELAAELARKGFTAAVREDTTQGKALYRVLAGSGLGREAALEVLVRLSGAGYAGLLISEAR
jgi:cell division septation protein DedD